MTKISCFLAIVFFFIAIFSSCKKDKNDEPFIVTHSLVKSITIETYHGDNEGYEYIYDTNFEKIIRVEEFWDGSYQSATNYDYSVAGKLFLVDPLYELPFKEFDINDKEFVTKEFADYSWFEFTYDTNGFLSKYSYLSLPDGDLIMENEIIDGNIIKQTTYEANGEVSKFKEFTYTNIDNVNNLDPDCFFRPNYSMPVQMFGNSSKKLPDFIEFWDPRSSSPKLKITYSYKFDDKNRVSKIFTAFFGEIQYTYTYNYYD